MPFAESPGSSPSLTTPISHPTAKPFSISLSISKTSLHPSAKNVSLNTKKRPHSALADGSDSDNDGSPRAPQLLSSFDQSAGGAIGVEATVSAKAPLVIQSQTNRNWRDESRRKRGKNILPAEERAAREGRVAESGQVRVEEEPQWGLILAKARTVEEDVEIKEEETEGKEAQIAVPGNAKSKTIGEEALEALTGDGKTKSTLVLPDVSGENGGEDVFEGRVRGEDAFKSDVASRPESASLEAYAAVPIEEFGAALLRGMGWKEGDAVGKRKDRVVKPRIPERRPALLGVGAKEVPEGLEELGAWGKGSNSKKKAVKYSPVLLKNSKTGEMLTEDEMKAKQESVPKKEEDDWRERRDRNLIIDDIKKSSRRYRIEDAPPHESSRQSSSRRERSLSPQRRWERRRRDLADRNGHGGRDKERRHKHKDEDDNNGRGMERRHKTKDDDRVDPRSSKQRDRRDYNNSKGGSQSSGYKGRDRQRDDHDDARLKRH